MMRINECSCGCGGTSDKCSEKSEYMFFGNLETIKRAVDSLLELDPEEVEMILQDGHAWAIDHIATSKDDIEEVAGFLMNKLAAGKEIAGHEENIMTVDDLVKMTGKEVNSDPFAEKEFIHTFESFLNESKR
jgi:hypothetical protein